MFDMVRKNLLQIQEDIEPCKPRIIAVTKYFDKDAMIAAYEAGLRDFGESRAVEASQKIKLLPENIRSNSTFHFIGHLQSNKVKLVVQHFDYIQSVDSLKIAQCISDKSNEIGKIQKVLLEVNIADEEQKFGFSEDEILEVFAQIKMLSGVEICGLMNMAPIDANEDELHRIFSKSIEIRNKLEEKYNCKLKEVSMGMSRDYKIAAQEGSTMLRVGRKLFS